MKKNNSIKRAIIINGSLKYMAALINIFFAAVLARVLLPQDFGIVAVTTVFVNFFKVIADAGMGPAIIQYKQLTKRDMNSIFTFSLYIAMALSTFMLFLATPVSKIYKNEEYIRLFPLLSISVFFYVLNTVPNALLMREKRFVKVGIRTVISTSLSSIIAFLMAIKGAGCYALMMQSVSNAIITFIWNMHKSGLRIKGRINKSVLRLIGAYSGYQFAFNFINYFSRNMDNLLIGKFLGNLCLAYYEKSYTVMMYPIQGLPQVITPVLHPIMSDYQNDKDKIYEQYWKIVCFLSVTGCFISSFCVLNAKEIILIIFGEKWSGAIPSMRILGISIWAQMIVSVSGTIYQSIGNTKLLLLTGLLGAFTTVGAIALGLYFASIECVALFVTGAYIVMVFVTNFILMKWGFYKSPVKIKKILPEAVFLTTICGLYFILGTDSNNLYQSFIIKSMLIMLAFVLYLFVTKRYKIFELILRRKK